MKVILIFKWSRDPQDARVNAAGTVDWADVRMAASDDDPAALAVAKSLAGGDEIVGLTIGDGDAAWAAARGAGRSVVVTDAGPDLSADMTGAVLAAAVRRIGDADAVVIGDSAWDYGIVAGLAAELGWPTLAGVLSAEEAEGGQVQVTRRLGDAAQVVDVAPGGVLLAVMASRAEQQVPGMREVLAGRRKPVMRLKMADLGLAPMEADPQSLGTAPPAAPPAHLIDGANPAAAAAELLAALRTEGVL